jgi:DNA repair exonuclease SbcCD ATPase subunit
VKRLLRAIAEAQKTLSPARLIGDIAAFTATGETARRWSDLLGLADDASLESIRNDLRELFEQVARLREREVALAGGLSQLRARAVRFDDALAGLARVQGRYVARMAAQQARAERVEHLAYRRDDHITRLIRDTAAQRSEIERLVRELEDDRRTRNTPVPEPQISAPSMDPARLQVVERQFEELRKAQKSGTQSVIDTLESLRERLARLEARAIEMSREARAKTGRLDALARHVASVDGRLSSAIGGHGAAGGSLVPTVERAEAPAVLGGQT